MTPAIGTRVRVAITDRSQYAKGAAEALDGSTGIVEKHRADGEVLVRFDHPVAAWSTWQSPPRAFWFLPCNLGPLPVVDVSDDANENWLRTVRDKREAAEVTPRPSSVPGAPPPSLPDFSTPITRRTVRRCHCNSPIPSTRASHRCGSCDRAECIDGQPCKVRP